MNEKITGLRWHSNRSQTYRASGTARFTTGLQMGNIPREPHVTLFSMPFPIHITAFYLFYRLKKDRLKALREQLWCLGKEHDMRGLVILAEEGINGTVCGSPEALAAWKKKLTETFGAIRWNDSKADSPVFFRWFVKIRKEIVALKQPNVKPTAEHNHLSPEEWEKVLEEEDVVLLDTRNTYETEIGMFEGAVDPKLKNFQEFPDFTRTADLPRDKKVLMYCTGGIRCEKAALEMEKQGFKHVYQLKGGILAYLKKFPNKRFKGECFIFDHRVSVNQNMEPSDHYALCPACGDPGDQPTTCRKCGKETALCVECLKNEKNQACSRLCRSLLKEVLV